MMKTPTLPLPYGMRSLIFQFSEGTSLNLWAEYCPNTLLPCCHAMTSAVAQVFSSTRRQNCRTCSLFDVKVYSDLFQCSDK